MQVNVNRTFITCTFYFNPILLSTVLRFKFSQENGIRLYDLQHAQIFKGI